MATKLGRTVTYFQGLQTIEDFNALITSSCKVYLHYVPLYLHYISTTRLPIATKLRGIITYLDGLLPIKSHDPLITLSCEIM